jgi:hypothetical protein
MALVFVCRLDAANAATLGDVTGDGRVAVSDAVRLLRFATRLELPTTEQRILGDVIPRSGTNGRPVGDQNLDIRDAIQLLRYSVGLLTGDEFGASEQFIALTPRLATVGPSDQMQFTAVPVNFEGTIAWSLEGDGSPLGDISTDGLYIAPGRLIGDLSLTVIARSGSREARASLFVTDAPPPPPPPI